MGWGLRAGEYSSPLTQSDKRHALPLSEDKQACLRMIEFALKRDDFRAARMHIDNIEHEMRPLSRGDDFSRIKCVLPQHVLPGQQQLGILAQRFETIGDFMDYEGFATWRNVSKLTVERLRRWIKKDLRKTMQRKDNDC